MRRWPLVALFAVLACGEDDNTDDRHVEADAAIDAARVEPFLDAATDAALRPDPDATADGAVDAGSAELALTQGDISQACGLPLTAGNALYASMPRFTGELALTSDRLLAFGPFGSWTLWDLATRKPITSGRATAGFMANNTLLIVNGGLLEFRDASDGHVRGTTFLGYDASPLNVRHGIARDGSYVWTATMTALRIWNPDGTMRLEVPGNFLNEAPFASAGELRVPRRQADGTTTLERISASTGSITSSTIAGVFMRWFQDGERMFNRTAETTVRVFRVDGSAEGELAVAADDWSPPLGGDGPYVWSSPSQGPLEIYRTTDTEHALFSEPGHWFVMSSPQKLLLKHYPDSGPDTTYSFDPSMSAPTPVVLPHAELRYGVFAADGSAVFADEESVLHHLPVGAAQPTSIGCGGPLAVALSVAGSYAVGTAAGQILVGSVAQRSLAYVLPMRAAELKFSHDGTILGALDQDSRALRLYAVSSGTLLRELGTTAPAKPFVRSFSFAREAPRLLVDRCSADESACEQVVLDAEATTTFYTLPSADAKPVLSSLGHAVASYNGSTLTDNTITTLYRDGALVGSATGIPITWLDDQRLLLRRFAYYDPPVFGTTGYSYSVLVDATGNVLPGDPRDYAALGSFLGEAKILRDGGAIFSPYPGLYTLPRGEPIWTASGNPSDATDHVALHVGDNEVILTSF